jgi:hypothetical protein
MDVLLRDPCCLAGLGILAVGGMIALVSLVSIKVKDAWRKSHASQEKEVRDA